MNNIDQLRLARLRPDKLDDVAVKEQISIIQQKCEDVDPEIIALVFHECDYNFQQTIARIQARDYKDGGWQTAKSNHKKKNLNNHNIGDQITNSNTLSDNERSLSQRTSPTSSFRDGHRRNDHYPYASTTRMNTARRGNDLGRNHFIPSNQRYSSRTNPINKSVPLSKTTILSEQIPSEISSLTKQSTEELPQIISPSTDEYEFVDGVTQSLSFDNSQKKIPTKRRIQPSIPPKPVSMHRTIQFSTEPIDIQFGDVQWNDSVPVAVNSSDNTSISTAFNNHEQGISSTTNTDGHNQHDQDTLSSNYIDHTTANEPDIQFLETTDQFSSSLSLADNTISYNLSMVPADGTSHLSDHLTNISSPVSTQSASQPQIPITRLPPTSTPRAPEYTSPTSQFLPHNVQQNNMAVNSSAFAPFNHLGNYQSMQRDYPQTTAWNPQSSNYKISSKQTILPTGTYQPQSSYQLPPQQQQQQQIILGTYPYSTLSPTVVQVLAPIDQWSTGGFPAPYGSYQYAHSNYIPTYSNQQAYHPQTKYGQDSYDKEFFANYGQTRSSNNDLSYQPQQQQQQPSTPSQLTKDTHITSKLSPTAATFSQGASLTPSASATALYLNPVAFSMPNYIPSVSGPTHQDRILSYSNVDNRDNRNGASYGNTNNRNNYYHHGQQQQQRTHNPNVSNSTWHSQQ